MVDSKPGTRKNPKDAPPSGHFPLKPLFWVLLSAAVLPVLCLFLLHLAPVQKEIIDTLIRRVEESTQLKIDFAAYRWSPFSGLEFDDFHVTAQGKPVVAGSRAELSYGLGWSWPYLQVREIYLDKPSFHFEKTPEGRWQIPGVRPQKGGGAPSETPPPHFRVFPLPKLRVASGTITAEQGGKTVLSVKDVTGVLSFGFVPGPDGPRLTVDLGQIQGSSEIPAVSRWALSGRITVDGQSVDLGDVSVELGAESRVTAAGSFLYRPPFDGTLSIAIAQLAPADLPLMPRSVLAFGNVSGNVQVRSQSGRIFLDHDLTGSSGSAKGSLRLDLLEDEKAFRWIADLDGWNLAPFFKQPETLLSGHLEITATTTRANRPEDLKADFSLKVQPSRVADIAIQSGEIHGNCENGHVEIEGSTLRTSTGNLALKAEGDLLGLWDPGHKGDVRLDLHVEQAALDRLVTKVTQKLGGSFQVEAAYGPGDFLNFAKWHGKLDSTLNIPDFLKFKAQVGYDKQTISGTYELEAPDIQRLSSFVPGFQGKGKVASKGALKGTWPDLVWEGTLNSPSFQYGTVQCDQISATGKGKITGKEAKRDLTLKIQNTSIGGKKLGSLNVEFQQQEESLRAQVKAEGLLDGVATRFTCHIDGLFSPQRTVTLSQGGITWKGGTASLDGKLEITEERVRIPSIVLAQGKQRVTVSGEVNREGRSDVKLSLDQIVAEQWLQTFEQKQVLKGSVSGVVQISGRSDQPEASVNLTLSDGTLLSKERIRKCQISGSYARELLTLQGELSAEAMTAPATFSTKVPLHLSMSPFHFEVKRSSEWNSSVRVSGFRMETLKTFIPGLSQIAGTVDGEINVAGTPAQPTVRGSGAWRDGRVVAAKWPHPVENIQVEWRADAREFYIERGGVDLLGGHVDLKGRASLFPQLNVELNATGKDVRAPEFYGITGTVDGPAKLVLTAEGVSLTGTLDLSKANMDLGKFESDLARNIKIIDGESRGDIIEIGGDEKPPPNSYNKLSMGLLLQLPPTGTKVHGKGLDTEITGSLKIEKDALTPIRYSGSLQTIRGSYTIQGVSLDIIEGELAFLGKARPDPNVRIVCQKSVRDVVIQVQVTGPMKSPKLAMSSIPAMNQVDILSYLMYQQPAGQLSSKQTMQLQDRAATWLGSETSTMLKSVFGNNRFAPDTVEYKSATGRTDGFGGSQFGSTSKTEGGVVEIGKHITPDLYINYGRGVMGQEGNQVQLEYRFNRHLSVQTQVGGADQSGVDVFWRHDFGK